jgi:hypothetical protein
LLALTLVVFLPAGARAVEEGEFKAEVEAFIARVEPTTNGALKWAGSDPIEIRRDGDAFVAVISNARLRIEAAESAELALDRVEFRRVGERDNGKLVELALVLPKEATLREADGSETRIMLKDGTATGLLDAQSGRGRASTITLAGGRIEHAKSGVWINFGPISVSSKLVAEANGGWSGPVDFSLDEIEFFSPQGPLGGTVGRIAYTGKTGGPKYDDVEKLRDTLDTLQKDATPSTARLATFLDMLPKVPALFTRLQGEFSLERLVVRIATGEPLVSLDKAEIAAEITGLDGTQAAARFAVKHDGLDISPTLLDQTKVPHRVIVDFGVENVATDAIRTLIEAGSKMGDASGASEAEKQRAGQQLMSAAASLNPTFRIYAIGVDTQDVGAELTAQATGSPLSPKGYKATGELSVRGFAAIPHLGDVLPFAEYLPVLGVIGVEGKAADGSPRLAFHLASAPPRWITINDNDVSAWFGSAKGGAGEGRVLKPADPPMQGNDVRAVQKALTAAKIAAPEDGKYGGSTAAAVARFQKAKGLNVDGVVDPATRQRLLGK